YAVPPAFWTQVLPRLRSRFPEVYVFGEVIHGDYAQVVTDSGMDSVTQYELWQAVWHGLAEENFYELDWCLGRHAHLLPVFVPVTFLGNHDTTRI
ncbi:alpha-amylase, partial [Actinotignum timonense]|nr:alpha-amylase [Actinotignum timonense]